VPLLAKVDDAPERVTNLDQQALANDWGTTPSSALPGMKYIRSTMSAGHNDR